MIKVVQNCNGDAGCRVMQIYAGSRYDAEGLGSIFEFSPRTASIHSGSMRCFLTAVIGIESESFRLSMFVAPCSFTGPIRIIHPRTRSVL